MFSKAIMASQAETNLAIGKEKKDAGDQSFRNGDIKSGLQLYYLEFLELLTLRNSFVILSSSVSCASCAKGDHLISHSFVLGFDVSPRYR